MLINIMNFLFVFCWSILTYAYQVETKKIKNKRKKV